MNACHKLKGGGDPKPLKFPQLEPNHLLSVTQLHLEIRRAGLFEEIPTLARVSHLRHTASKALQAAIAASPKSAAEVVPSPGPQSTYKVLYDRQGNQPRSSIQ
jgi:hypothetical protein